jgi:tetratricopeptide (TPR) repeat protein
MAKHVDVFVSHHHVDAAPVRVLADALTKRGVQVRLGKQDVADASSITRQISQELAGAKALVAYYSTAYATRRACQWELTAALIAGGRHGDAGRRVLVVNPEPSLSHIHPLKLRSAVHEAPATADGQNGLVDLADRIALQVAGLTTPLGTMGSLVGPRWMPELRMGSARFAGRLSELWEVHSGLQAGGMVAVSGSEGVGKSLLAEEYALRFGAAYPGGVVWLRAYGHERSSARGRAGLLTGQLHDQVGVGAASWQAVVDLELRAVAAGLNLPLNDPDPARLRSELAAAIQASGKPWLWVVDDLPDGLEEDQLEGLLAPHPLAVTLLTTRGGERHPVAPALNLGPLSRSDGYLLLTSRRRPRGIADQQVAQEIVTELGGHPLALDVAAAALAGQNAPAAAAELRKPSGPLPRTLASDLEGLLQRSHTATIARALAGSIGGLSDEGSDLLRLAAELATAPIPIRVLTEVFLVADQLGQREAAGRAATAVQQVLRARLARPTDERADRLEIHPLITQTARSTDPKPMRRAAVRTAAAEALARAIEAVDAMDPPAQPVLWDTIAHAHALLGHLGDPASQAETHLLGALARSAYASGHHLTAASLFQEQWNTSRRLLGEEHPATLAAMDSLMGTLHAMEGQIGGRELYEQVLAIRRRMLGEEHPATLAAMHRLAEWLQALGDVGKARPLYEQILVTNRRTLGDDHVLTLDSMSKVAMLKQATGAVAEARELHEQVLSARRRTLGEDHPDTLNAIYDLAGTLFRLAELAEARALYLQALAARKRTLGEAHPDTLAAMSNLGLVLQANGELAEARALHEQVAILSQQVFGDEHPATLAAMNNLAGIVHALGELVEARELHEQVVAACRRVLGDEHPDTLTAMANLGLTLHDLWELDQARQVHEHVLAIRRRTLGEDHPDTLDATGLLAATLHHLGEFDRARQLQAQTLAACQRVYGEDHLETLTAMSRLARTLHDLGELAEARGLQERTLAACRRVLGPEHAATLDSMIDLAATLDAEGHRRKARSLRAQAEQRSHRRGSPIRS